MAEPQIVTTLSNKRDELERIIGSYEKAIELPDAISRM
jgi:exonuclease VII small subunit